MPVFTALTGSTLVVTGDPVDPVSNNQFEPILGISGNNLVVVYIDFTASNVILQFRDLQGPTIQTTGVNNPGGGAIRRLPGGAVRPDGSIDIVWQEETGGIPVVYHRLFGANGSPITAPTIVSVSPNLQFGPNNAALANGGIAYAWEEIVSPGNVDVFARFFDANGAALGNAFPVHNGSAGGQINSSIITLSNGNALVVFGSFVNGVSTIQGQILSPLGVPIGGPIIIDADAANFVVVDPALLAFENSFVVSYKMVGANNTTNILTKQFTNDGEFIGSNSTSDPNPANINNGSVSLTRVDAATAFASWISTDQTAAPDPMRGQAFDLSNGVVPYGAPFTIADSARFMLSGSSIRLPNGNLLFSWDGSGFGDSQGIFTRTFAVQSNASVGPAVQVSATPEGDERNVSVTALGDGLVTSWTEGVDVVFRQWQANLVAVGDVKSVGAGDNSVVIDLDSELSIAVGLNLAEQDGETPVVADEFDVSEVFRELRIPIVQDGSLFDLQSMRSGYRYSHYEIASTANEQVTIFAQNWGVVANVLLGPIGSDGRPSNAIAALNGSGLVAIRLEYAPGNSTLIGQRYATDGSLAGPEFQIASGPGLVDQLPDVTALPGGGFVVVWSEDLDDEVNQLVARRFDALGNALGARIVVKNFTGNFLPTDIDVTATDKGFLVSWVEGIGGGGSALQSRGFYDDGNPIDTFFTIDQSATGSILFGSHGVTQLSSGEIIYGYSLPATGPAGSYDALLRGIDLSTDYQTFEGSAANNTIDPSQTGRLEIRGLDGNDTLNGRASNDRLDGGSGDDVMNGRAGGDIMLGGLGNDAGLIDNSLDFFDGGAGVDSAVVQGNYSNFLVDIVDTEVLIAASGGDTRFGDLANNFYDYSLKVANSAVSLGGTLTVIGTELRVGEDLTWNSTDVVTGNLRVFAGASATTVNFGAGSDGAFFGVNGNPLTLMVNGGAGADSIAFRGNYNFTLPAGSIDNVEVLVLLTGLANPFGGFIVPGGFDYNVSLANNSFAGVSRLDVVGSSLGIGESMFFNASAVTNGSVRIFGGADRDDLAGTANNDIIAGQGGGDRHDGGLGDDLYVIRALSESTLADPDLFIWGSNDDDTVDISFIDADANTMGNQAFSWIGAAAFSGVAGQFRLTLVGAVWVGEGDVNGDSVADFRFGIQAPPANPPTIDDFIF